MWPILEKGTRTRLEKRNRHPIMHSLAGRRSSERRFYITNPYYIKERYEFNAYKAAIAMPNVDGA